jgi:hypothetical protein
MDPGCVVMDAWGKTEEARQAMKAVGAGDDGGGASGIAELWKARHCLRRTFAQKGRISLMMRLNLGEGGSLCETGVSVCAV